MRRTLVMTAGLLAVGLTAGLSACSTAPTSAPAGSAAAAAQRPAAVTVARTTSDGTKVLAEAKVGDVVFLLGRRGAETRLAASFDGSDPDTNWELVTPRPTVGATAVTVVSAANFPDAAPDGLAQVAGQVGTDVTSIDIRDHAGATHHVAVSNGFYLAAWNGHDFDDRDTLDAAFDIHLKDGTTTTRTYLQLSDR